jgi:bifunctional non-homologous end joining protein LigD
VAEAFPEIMLLALPVAALDGELIVPDRDGRSDFESLRRRSLTRRPRAVARAASGMLVVFVVLEVQGRDMRMLELSERRDWLLAHVRTAKRLQLAQYPTHGEALFREIVQHDREGIVAKHFVAPYRAGRQPTWLKIKNKDYSRRAAVEWQGR